MLEIRKFFICSNLLLFQKLWDQEKPKPGTPLQVVLDPQLTSLILVTCSLSRMSLQLSEGGGLGSF